MKMNEENKRGRIWKNYTRDALKREDWSKMYNTEDINIAVEVFTKKLISILDSISPIGNFNNKVKYKSL